MTLRRFHGLCFTTALAAAMATATAPASALTVELKDVAGDRIERQRSFAQGALPLPGTPDLSNFASRLTEQGLKAGNPVFIRIFKSESELEVWMQKDGAFVRFATYPMCHWSGTLGPKVREGDKQTPEGFYTITRNQLHRIGRWPRSLNLGFPNAYDQSLARYGSYILVHGGCSSVGCFAMTNAVIEEIYNLTEAAIRGGQAHVPVHVFPFRMTDDNLAKNSTSEWSWFWQNLKEGHDAFHRTSRPPQVGVCNGRYTFQDDDTSLTPAMSSPKKSALDVCPATRATIDALYPLMRVARRQNLPVPATGAIEWLKSRAALGGPQSADPETVKLRPSCSLALPSCRKHMTLQVRMAARRAAWKRNTAEARGRKETRAR